MNSAQPLVAIIMGSDSDWSVMSQAREALEKFGISCQSRVISAHRSPEDMMTFALTAREEGIRVIIAGAGGAAHLPGMVAALTTVPVIGVPVPLSRLDGVDSLYSIVQMPRGVPVATMAIGGAYNAGLFAARLIGMFDPVCAQQLEQYRLELRDLARAKDNQLSSQQGNHHDN